MLMRATMKRAGHFRTRNELSFARNPHRRLVSCFKPHDFAELLDSERQWFALLDALRHLRWQRISPEKSPEGQAVLLMLRDRVRWLRN